MRREQCSRVSQRSVEAAGFRICYMQAGPGPELVDLHGAGGLRPTRTHELLSPNYRVVAFKMSDYGASASTASN